MMIPSILSILLAGCLLALVICIVGSAYLGQQDSPNLETVDNDAFFDDWEELAPRERKKRLAVYQRRVRARIAEQEVEWLRARLRECVKG